MSVEKNEIIIDGEYEEIDEAKLTPAEYFEKIKSLKKECTEEDFIPVIEFAEAQLKKFKLLKQADAAQITSNYIEMFKKEIKIIRAGFTTYVEKKDIEHYMSALSDKAVFCTELQDFPREIPDEIVDKIADNMDIFDHLYVIFTDYTQEISKHIDKKTREKDPILFGAVDIEPSNYRPIPGPRYYFIGDWVDSKCDLTLDKILDTFKFKEERNDVKKTASIPSNKDEFRESVELYKNQVDGDFKGTLVKVPTVK